MTDVYQRLAHHLDRLPAGYPATENGVELRILQRLFTADEEEALEKLRIGMAAGLMLQPGNAKKPTNICMCCGCCCQVLKNLKTLDSPAKVVHTNYYAEVIM